MARRWASDDSTALALERVVWWEHDGDTVAAGAGQVQTAGWSRPARSCSASGDYCSMWNGEHYVDRTDRQNVALTHRARL
jgi:hypothetical protein